MSSISLMINQEKDKDLLSLMRILEFEHWWEAKTLMLDLTAGIMCSQARREEVLIFLKIQDTILMALTKRKRREDNWFTEQCLLHILFSLLMLSLWLSNNKDNPCTNLQHLNISSLNTNSNLRFSKQLTTIPLLSSNTLPRLLSIISLQLLSSNTNLLRWKSDSQHLKWVILRFKLKTILEIPFRELLHLRLKGSLLLPNSSILNIKTLKIDLLEGH